MWQNVLQLSTVLMGFFGYPYNDLVIYVRIALIIYTRHMTSKDCYKFSFIPRTIIQCIRKRCFLYHVTGSERPNYIPLNSDQHNPNSRPQNLGLPASLQRNSNPKTPPRPIQYCPNDSDYVRSHDLYAEQGPNLL